MPYSIDLDTTLIRIRLFGSVTPDELRALALAVQEAERASRAPLDRLTDLTDIKLGGMLGGDVRMLVRARAQYPLIGPTRSAIVAPRNIEFGLARMFQMLNRAPQLTIRVFRSLDEAMAWLAEPWPPAGAATISAGQAAPSDP